MSNSHRTKDHNLCADFARRTKLSHDPNNTVWSRSSDKYGQRILESQGWTPGNVLGAKDSAYANLHTPASSSHIRITLKDDNLGLGAKRGAGQEVGNNTGLDMFQDVLGRLNGKNQHELKKEQDVRSCLRRSVYLEQKWGRPCFVSGGLLVSDDLQKLSKAQAAIRRSRVGMADIVDYFTEEEILEPGQKTQVEINKSSSDQSNRSRKQKPHSASSQKIVPMNTIGTTQQAQDIHAVSPECSTTNMDRARERAEKAERKLRRQMKRERRHITANEANKTQETLPPPCIAESQPACEERGSVASHIVSTGTIVSKASPVSGGGRHVIRQRNIRHKKMSIMNSQALNEVSHVYKAWQCSNVDDF